MSQHTQADLIKKLRQLHDIKLQQQQLVKEVYELTQEICQNINRELGGLQGLTVSDINVGTLDLLIFSLPTFPEWTIAFYGETLTKCTVYGSHDVLKPGFAMTKKKVSFGFSTVGLKVFWMLVGNETRWYILDEKQKAFIPIDNLKERVKMAFLEAMTTKVETLIQEHLPSTPTW